MFVKFIDVIPDFTSPEDAEWFDEKRAEGLPTQLRLRPATLDEVNKVSQSRLERTFLALPKDRFWTIVEKISNAVSDLWVLDALKVPDKALLDGLDEGDLRALLRQAKRDLDRRLIDFAPGAFRELIDAIPKACPAAG